MPFRLFLLVFCLLITRLVSVAQYFPPTTSTAWDSITPQQAGFCQLDSLNNYLINNRTRAFILLKGGRRVVEWYFNGAGRDSLWYWASAGKTLTSLAVGLAQQEGRLNIEQATSTYLGQGWTSLTPAQEGKIKIRHQLSMTTGLSDLVPVPDCTLPSCLTYLADTGTRWAYHNAPYTLLDEVVTSATGANSLTAYLLGKLTRTTGFTGAFTRQNFNNVFYSTARSMARYGLLMANKGSWNGTRIIDSTWLNTAMNTSQMLNPAYGYLWWLNGKSSYMIPQVRFSFPGSIAPNGPGSAVMAMGKNGQFVSIVQSEDLVWIRMGEEPTSVLVPFLMADEIWKRVTMARCVTSLPGASLPRVYNGPNPIQSGEPLLVESNGEWALINATGKLLHHGMGRTALSVDHLPTGLYWLRTPSGSEKVVKQ